MILSCPILKEQTEHVSLFSQTFKGFKKYILKIYLLQKNQQVIQTEK